MPRLGAPDFGIAPMIEPIIEKNRVRLQPRTGLDPVFSDGIDLVGVVSGAYVGENAIEGGAFAALGLYDLSAEEGDLGFNTYAGNQIASFVPNTAHVFLDTAAHDTVFKGFSGSVIDLGSNNHITGVSAGGHAATGEQVREATRRRIASSLLVADDPVLLLVGPSAAWASLAGLGPKSGSAL